MEVKIKNGSKEIIYTVRARRVDNSYINFDNPVQCNSFKAALLERLQSVPGWKVDQIAPNDSKVAR